MNGLKKAFGIALAGCMAFSSLALSAGAANLSNMETFADNSPMALSRNAGDTLDCNLVVVDEAGSVSETFFDVDLPATATNADQKEIVMDTVDDLIGQPTTRASRAIWETLQTRSGVSIPKNTGTTSVMNYVCSVPLRWDYDTVELYMSNISPSIGNLNVRMEAKPNGGPNTITLMNQTVTNRTCVVTVYKANSAYSPRLNLAAGNTLNAHVSGVSGSGTLNSELMGHR